MSMATVQFYKNKYNYPDYSESLTSYGTTNTITPNNINIKSGTIKVNGTMTDFMNCNYIRIMRNNQTLYAWIENVEYHTTNSFLVTYTVDAFRTWKNKINLGTQYIERSPVVTSLKDNMLSSTQWYPNIETKMYKIGKINEITGSTKRYFVVQVRGDETYFGISATPVNPTSYQFYFCEYDAKNWRSTKALSDLMVELSSNGKPINIVTMYSIPYVNLDVDGFRNEDLIIKFGGVIGDKTITGFKVLGSMADSHLLNWIETPLNLRTKVIDILNIEHNIQLVIPEAGVINIPTEIALKNDLVLRQDVDIYNGASNYMLKSSDEVYQQSVRGSSISNVPVVSDPYDTYISQNQNTLATSLIGDVATVSSGIITGGAGAVIGGIGGIASKIYSMEDIRNKPSNPPAFLGTALANNYNQHFWIVITYQDVKNNEVVNSRFGYPYNMIDNLYIPSNGYIKTDGCNVSSTDGSVPKWALEDINQIFNNGLRVH